MSPNLSHVIPSELYEDRIINYEFSIGIVFKENLFYRIHPLSHMKKKFYSFPSYLNIF